MTEKIHAYFEWYGFMNDIQIRIETILIKLLLFTYFLLVAYLSRTPNDETVFRRIAYVGFSFRYGNVLILYYAFIYAIKNIFMRQ